MAAEVANPHYSPRELARIAKCVKALKSVSRILVEPHDGPGHYHLVEEKDMKNEQLLAAFAAVHRLGEDAVACDKAAYWAYTSSRGYPLPVLCEDDERMGFDGIVEGGFVIVIGFENGIAGEGEICRCGKIPRPHGAKKPRKE